MITWKSAEDIDRMARAGALVARALETVTAALQPGMTTLELDRIAAGVIDAAGATPSFKGYQGFPATLCTSRNQQIVHGIPSADVRLAAGELLSIDCGAIVEGFHGDSAVTVIVGGADAAPAEICALVDATRTALWRGLAQVQAGHRLGDIGAAVQAVADRQGYGVVREYVGHGIGRSLHEDPAVPNYGAAGHGLELSPGLVLAVEPMFNLGTAATQVLADGWTVETADGAWSAHWEHTVALTADGPRVLTARSDEPGDPRGWPADAD